MEGSQTIIQIIYIVRIKSFIFFFFEPSDSNNPKEQMLCYK